MTLLERRENVYVHELRRSDDGSIGRGCEGAL